MASNLYPSTGIWRFSFYLKKKHFNELRKQFCISLFGDISSIIKKLLGANVPAFINNLGPNNKPKMLKVGP
jgi:hypothetical protein